MEDITSIFRSLNALYYNCAKSSGISEAAFYIMMAVYVEPVECTQADICDKWAMSRQTVNSALKKLEREDYLTLTPASSGKKKVIGITEKGLRYTREYIEPVFSYEKQAWASLSQDKQKMFLNLAFEYLRAFKDAMEQGK